MSIWNSSTVQSSTTNPYINNRFTKKDEKERRYEKLFPPYHPRKPYVVYFVNSLTTDNELQVLCGIIKCANDFVSDTESDIHSHKPAVIQVLIVQTDPEPSPILIIETCFLPDTSSSRFRQIQTLFYQLFRTGTNLYSWSCLINELTRFQSYQLFSLPVRSSVFDVQRVFTGWFNEYFNTKDNYDNTNTTDSTPSIILNAPGVDPELFLSLEMINHINVMNNELWSLQDGVAYVFYNYLSKRETLRPWSIGLDERLSSRDKSYSPSYRKQLIQYACYDCSSLLEIVSFIYENYLSNHLVDEPIVQSLGEYFSYLTTKFVSLVKTRKNIEILFEDESDDLMTVHELDERHQISSEDRTDEQLYDIDPRQEGGMNYNAQENNLEVILDFSGRKKSEPKRSTSTRKRRNQKSSLRHRRNRYKFELIRPVNINISNVKKILRLHAVPYLNINIVQSTLHIGLKSQDFKDYYERLLSMDLFI